MYVQYNIMAKILYKDDQSFLNKYFQILKDYNSTGDETLRDKRLFILSAPPIMEMPLPIGYLSP